MLTVRDLMSNALDSVTPDASLHDALSKMNRAGFRHLPVVDAGKLVGIITERDLRLAVNSPVLDEDLTPRETVLNELTVGECMTPDPQFVSPDAAAHEVADLLSLNKFGAMPVVKDGALIGMISYVDYLKHFATHPPAR